jgi:hypothetical protein
MRDPRRASAGKTLKALRQQAEVLRRWGWHVEEPPDALEHVYRQAKRAGDDFARKYKEEQEKR